MKMFLKFHNQGDVFDEVELLNVYETITKNKIKLSRCGINFLQIPSFNDLISTLELTVQYKFEINKSKNWLIYNLKKDNIDFYIDGDDIQFYINSYEHMKKYGSKKWCITQSLKYFLSYKNNKNIFCIIYKFKNEKNHETYGLTLNPNNNLVDAFNSQNKSVKSEIFFIKKENIKIGGYSKVVFNNDDHHLMIISTIIALLYTYTITQISSYSSETPFGIIILINVVFFPLTLGLSCILSVLLFSPIFNFKTFILNDTNLNVSRYFSIVVLSFIISIIIGAYSFIYSWLL